MQMRWPSDARTLGLAIMLPRAVLPPLFLVLNNGFSFRTVQSETGAMARLLASVPPSCPSLRVFHLPFVGTRCFSSSNQLRTTTMLAGVAFGSPSEMLLIIRNRWPSSDSS